MPAFFFMTFVTLISSIIIVSQSDLKEIINSKISSIFFVSNFFFYFSRVHHPLLFNFFSIDITYSMIVNNEPVLEE